MSDEDREAFEKWHDNAFEEIPVWNPKRNLYEEFAHHMAWKGWQAAAAHYGPKLTETHAAGLISHAIADYRNWSTFSPTPEAYAKRIMDTLRAAGLKFKEEA